MVPQHNRDINIIVANTCIGPPNMLTGDNTSSVVLSGFYRDIEALIILDL